MKYQVFTELYFQKATYCKSDAFDCRHGQCMKMHAHCQSHFVVGFTTAQTSKRFLALKLPFQFDLEPQSQSTS